MNSTQKVILQQLENEGIHVYTLWGTQFVDFGHTDVKISLGASRDPKKAVENAIKTTLRVGGLLAKYHDSLISEETGTLGDLLVTSEEDQDYRNSRRLDREARRDAKTEEPGDTEHGCIVVSL